MNEHKKEKNFRRLTNELDVKNAQEKNRGKIMKRQRFKG